jgi:transcriptional regulator with XRE-family HTH domain
VEFLFRGNSHAIMCHMQNPLDNLDDALAAKGWSQSELSRVTGIDRTLCNRYCRGLEPTPANARKIEEALGAIRDGVRTPVTLQEVTHA